MPKNKKRDIRLPRLRWRGLTIQLFGLIVLPITVLLLVVTFGSISLHQRAMRDLVGERDERATRSAARAISEQLNHLSAAIHGMSLRASDDTLPEILLESSEFLFPDFTGGLALFTPQGDLIVSNSGDSIWENLDEETELIIRYLLDEVGPEPVFSSPVHIASQSEYYVFVFAAQNSRSPIVVGAFTPASIARSTLAGILTSGKEAAAFLVDDTYRLLYQTGGQPSVEDLQSHPGVSGALRGESGTTYLSLNGDESVISFSPVSPTNWALVMEEPWESVSNPLLISTQNAPLVLVPVLLLALVALWFGARQIIQPLQALESQAAALSWGDYDAISADIGGIEEIQRLQSELKHLAHKVQSSQEGLRGYIGAITTGQEEERNRLARELHDDTLQALIALNQRIQLALMPKEDPVTTEALEEIQELTVSTIDNLRRITRALRPQYLDDLGLVTALEMLARETSENTDIPVHFSVQGDQERLAHDVELALFRMAQEGLNNAARHSEAAQASLLISFDPDQLRMQIQDNGMGFEIPKSPAEFAPQGHFGLLGIHERAELIGAHLAVSSTPNEGTTLTITLPNN